HEHPPVGRRGGVGELTQVVPTPDLPAGSVLPADGHHGRRARVVVVVVVGSPPHGGRATAADQRPVGQQGGGRVRSVADRGGPPNRAVRRRVRAQGAVGGVDVDLVAVVRQHHRRAQATVGQGHAPHFFEGRELSGDQPDRDQFRVVCARRPRGEVG